MTAGIYRLQDEANHISFIGYSFNIEGLFKRYRFELGLNACSVKPLQAMYNSAHGNVHMEILEQTQVSDISSPDTEESMKKALEIWRRSLEAKGESVRVILL